jgi:hypothetical protein
MGLRIGRHYTFIFTLKRSSLFKIIKMGKKRRNKDYDVSGTVEVYNITRGRRRGTILNLGERAPLQNNEISSSIVIKRPIYEEYATLEIETQKILLSGSGDEGEDPLSSL